MSISAHMIEAETRDEVLSEVHRITEAATKAGHGFRVNFSKADGRWKAVVEVFE